MNEGKSALKNVHWHVFPPGANPYTNEYRKTYVHLDGQVDEMPPGASYIVYGLTIKPGHYAVEFAAENGGWTETLMLSDKDGKPSEKISVIRNGKVLMPERTWP